MKTMLQLHGCNGWGSTCVEAALELAGVPYERRIFNPDDASQWQRLRAINPLAQVPTLVLPGGEVMTESAAILLWIGDAFPRAKLLPPAGAPERAHVLRWLVFLAANNYAAIGIGDYPERWLDEPEARKALARGALARLESYWQIVEQQVQPAPYLGGASLGVLDIYAAMMTHWRPGRAWLRRHCPRLMQAVALTESHPLVGAVWERNFGTG